MKEIIAEMMNGYWPAAEGDHDTCWRFCRHIYSLKGIELPATVYTLKVLAEPKLSCVVLFKVNAQWHSGIVWPDGLHFIHACQRGDDSDESEEYIIRTDRLTLEPWKQFIDGYYDV